MIFKNRLWTYALGGFLFLLDQLLKYTARTNPENIFVWKKIIGWEYYENSGVAFNLPLPSYLVLLLTPLVLLGIISFFIKNKKNDFFSNLELSLIVFGAVSNYVDRILFGATIDYLRVFTSILNLSDLMIALGVVLFIIRTNHSGEKI